VTYVSLAWQGFRLRTVAHVIKFFEAAGGLSKNANGGQQQQQPQQPQPQQQEQQEQQHQHQHQQQQQQQQSNGTSLLQKTSSASRPRGAETTMQNRPSDGGSRDGGGQKLGEEAERESDHGPLDEDMLADVKFPLSLSNGELVIESLGEIISNHALYHDANYFYPVGYRYSAPSAVGGCSAFAVAVWGCRVRSDLFATTRCGP